MSLAQAILEKLEGGELSVKELAIELRRSPSSLYKPLARLVKEGLIVKRTKVVQGREVAYYAVPKISVGGCNWETHKEILLAGKTYQKQVLKTDFWSFLKEDIQNLALRKENRHIAIVGLVGWGKSTTAIWLAKELDPTFEVDDIIFTKQQFLKLVVDQPKNKCFVLDDIGVMLGARSWREKEREIIFNFLEICRMNKVSTVATAPSLAMIDVNYQRLLHYVFQIELKCQDHVHIIVFKPAIAGLKPSFKPVGVLHFFYPKSVDYIVKQYQESKQQRLSLAAKDSLYRIEKLKEAVKNYVLYRDVTRITEDVVRSALYSIGLDGSSLSKEERDELRVVMYDTLEAKKQKKKRRQEELKEQAKKARLEASFESKYHKYIDQGRSLEFAETLAKKLVYEKSGHLRNLDNVANFLFRKVKPVLVEEYILRRLDDIYLVRDLRRIRDFLNEFKGFNQSFYTKIFAMFIFEYEKAAAFLEQARKMRESGSYEYHGKFSPKRWREAVVRHLYDLECKERSERGQVKFILTIFSFLRKRMDQQIPPFWGDF